MAGSLSSSDAADVGSAMPMVFIVDDDSAERRHLTAFVKSIALVPKSFSAVDGLLQDADLAQPGCVVLDLGSRGYEGLEWIGRVRRAAVRQPVIVRALAPDIPTAVLAMRRGAANFLDQAAPWELLSQAIEDAIALDAEQCRDRDLYAQLLERFAGLNPGERNVLEKLLQGKSNKVIAAELAVSVRTVEVRRSHLMRKTRAESLAELVRMAMTIAQADTR